MNAHSDLVSPDAQGYIIYIDCINVDGSHSKEALS